MQEIEKKVKELIKKEKQIEKDKNEHQDIAKPVHLVSNKDKRVLLDNLTIRPNITGKRSIGTVEAYQNGIRFMAR